MMRAYGLRTQIWNNNLKSIGLLLFYPVLIGFLIWVIVFAGYAMMFSSAQDAGTISAAAARAANTFIAGNFLFIVGGVVLWFIIAYFAQTKLVRMLSHAHPVTRAQEPELYNMTENLCIAAGMQTPRLEIIETSARNAFASGVNQATYTVTLTRGLLQSLQKDEVEAVIAHELTHIQNHDVRLLIVAIIFTGTIGFLAQLCWSSVRFNMFMPRGGNRKNGGGALIFILVVAAILWLGYMATLLTRLAISRKREYMADAGAIAMTKNPDGMMRALLRISGKDNIPETTDDIALMCIQNSKPFMGMFQTHPPIDKRVAAIAEFTQSPIPELSAGKRAENENRFKQPDQRQNPWLTAERRFRKNQ
jgi:heat shock protein HtpX